MFCARRGTTKRALVCVAGAFLSVGLAAGMTPGCAGSPLTQQTTAAPSTVARALGTVKAISGNNITLAPDKGPEVNIEVQPSARILRIEPGQTDLKSAVPITLTDVQPGDRILIAGRRSDDGKTILATSLVAMKHADVQAKLQQEGDAWQKGVGGLVSAIDPATGILTVKVASLGGSKDISIHTTKQTDFRRYAPDSVKFDDAKPSALDQIKVGDQVRARGTRNADGSELAADAVVAGSFRNVAGLISSVDATTKTIRLTDLSTKRPVLVRFTAQSEMRKLPPQMAQLIAVRLKGTPAGAAGAGGGGERNGGAGAGQPGGMRRGGGFGVARGGGPAGDLQQMLTRVPPVTLADFQKGDAVMIVSTEGAVADDVTAITMLGGVEPILEATPNGGQPMQLSPWSLGGGGGGEGDAGGDAGGGGGAK